MPKLNSAIEALRHNVRFLLSLGQREPVSTRVNVVIPNILTLMAAVDQQPQQRPPAPVWLVSGVALCQIEHKVSTKMMDSNRTRIRLEATMVGVVDPGDDSVRLKLQVPECQLAQKPFHGPGRREHVHTPGEGPP